MTRLRLLSAIALLAISACAAPPPSGSGIAPSSAATSAASGAGAVCDGNITVANASTLGVDQLFFKPAGAASWGDNRLLATRQYLLPDASLPFTATPPGVYDFRARRRSDGRFLQASNIDVCAKRNLTVTATGITAN
jgi:hypothetical protein